MSHSLSPSTYIWTSTLGSPFFFPLQNRRQDLPFGKCLFWCLPPSSSCFHLLTVYGKALACYTVLPLSHVPTCPQMIYECTKLLSTQFDNWAKVQKLSLMKTVVFIEARDTKSTSIWRTDIFPVFIYQKTDMQENHSLLCCPQKYLSYFIPWRES